MGVINKLTPLGIAYPMEKYPNPVRVTRAILHGLLAADLHGETDMFSPESVVAYFESNGDDVTKGWILANKDEYLRGLVDGFEVKRFRVQLEHADDTATVLREGDSLDELKRYSAELQQSYKQHGYTLQPRADKGVDIGRMGKAADGSDVFNVYVVFRLKVIPAREFTPVTKQRYPSAQDRTLQEQEGVGTPAS